MALKTISGFVKLRCSIGKSVEVELYSAQPVGLFELLIHQCNGCI